MTWALFAIWLALMSLAAASIWNPAWLQALSRPGIAVEARGRRMAGDALARRGEFARAVELYQRALAIEPENPEALMNLAVAYRELGRLEEARALLADSLARVASRRGTVYYNLGDVLQRQEKLDEALAAFEEAAQSPDPARASAWRRIAGLHVRAKRPAEARQAYEEALRLQLDPVAEYVAALAASRDSYQDDPEELAAIEAQLARGVSRADLARYDMTVIEGLLASDREIGRTHASLAGVCAWLGDLQAAREHCRQALRINPQDADARRLLAEMDRQAPAPDAPAP